MRIARQAAGFLVATPNLSSRSTRFLAVFTGFRASRFWPPVKLLYRLADNSFVQRSTLIAALSFALTGMALAGIAEWASGDFSSSGSDGSPSTALAASAGYASRVTAAPPSLPVLPDTSDHLPAPTPEYSFRRDIREVRLQFSVADEQGRLVQNLTPQQVRIFDNRVPVTRFHEFERTQNLPLRLGLVLDTSDSVRRTLPQEKSAAASFLARILRPETDTAFVMAFGGNVKLWQAPTANRQELFDAIARLQQPGWGTRLFDALYAACTDESKSDGKLAHRALIVLSDGDDTDSFRDLREAIAAAQDSETQIYALTIHSKATAERGDQVLRRLADATGGRQYIVQSSQDLDAAFAQIEQELRTQYYVSFAPQQATPGFHALHIEVRTPQKLEVRARQGYYATAQ
jgi:VWFA-related protein